MILSCESQSEGTYNIITRSHGNIKDTIPRASSTQIITVVDQNKYLIAIKCYDGILKLFNLSCDSKSLNVTTSRYVRKLNNSFITESILLILE